MTSNRGLQNETNFTERVNKTKSEKETGIGFSLPGSCRCFDWVVFLSLVTSVFNPDSFHYNQWVTSQIQKW